eukprot:29131-Chlamydomonas_euryale.AAC.1
MANAEPGGSSLDPKGARDLCFTKKSVGKLPSATTSASCAPRYCRRGPQTLGCTRTSLAMGATKWPRVWAAGTTPR